MNSMHSEEKSSRWSTEVREVHLRPEGYFAGKLIQDAGLKGYRCGDVMVSEKHSGFVVNVGKGTCHDAMQVIEHVQKAVYEQFGVELELEVKKLG